MIGFTLIHIGIYALALIGFAVVMKILIMSMKIKQKFGLVLIAIILILTFMLSGWILYIIGV